MKDRQKKIIEELLEGLKLIELATKKHNPSVMLQNISDITKQSVKKAYQALAELDAIPKEEVGCEEILETMNNVKEFHLHQEHPMPERYWKLIAKSLSTIFSIRRRGDEEV